MITECASSHTKVSLKELTEVHAAWYAHRVKNYVNWSTIFHKWHILNWKNARYDTLVTVTARKLIANTNLAHFGDINLDLHNNTRFKIIALFAGEDFYANDFAAIRSIHTNGGIANVFGFFAEDSAKEALLRTELLLALWRNFTNKDIAVANF